MELDLSAYDVPSSPEALREQAQPESPRDKSNDEFGELGVDGLGVEEVVAPTATRPKRARMDAERMLGERGLPKVRKLATSFRFKGKGHEKRDLQKLLGTYQLWAHKLFPKANFADFLVLCRNAGKETTVRAYRKRIIDEEKYPAPSIPDHEPSPSLELSDPPVEQVPPEHEVPSPHETSAVREEDTPEIEEAAPADHNDEGEEVDEDMYAAAMEAYNDMGF